MKTLSMLAFVVLLAGAHAGASAQDDGTLTNRIMVDGMYRRNLGEFGETWHHEGSLDRKQNAFDDFAACARRMVAAGYTSREKLAKSPVRLA